MTEKICTGCGQLNQTHANYCSSCGAQEFAEATAEQPQGISQGQGTAANVAMRISMPRILVLSVVTSGAYILYWLYLTWKHLKDETGEIHYPVWHALTWFIPVYGLFRLHKHVGVIQAVAQRAGVEVSITPRLAVTMGALDWVMVMVSGGVQSWGIFVALSLIRLVLITTVMVWSQATLNRYWSSTKGEVLKNVPIVREEVIFVLVVLFVQLIVNL